MKLKYYTKKNINTVTNILVVLLYAVLVIALSFSEWNY